MESNYSNENKLLIIKLTDEIDQHSADKVRRKIDDEIERFIPRKVVFNFDNISFMDSSGIGMVLGRYKLVKMIGGEFEIINVNKSIQKIFDMSGVTRIIKIKNKEENSEVIKQTNSESIKKHKERIEKQILDSIEKEEEDEGII